MNPCACMLSIMPCHLCADHQPRAIQAGDFANGPDPEDDDGGVHTSVRGSHPSLWQEQRGPVGPAGYHSASCMANCMANAAAHGLCPVAQCLWMLSVHPSSFQMCMLRPIAPCRWAAWPRTACGMLLAMQRHLTAGRQRARPRRHACSRGGHWRARPQVRLQIARNAPAPGKGLH